LAGAAGVAGVAALAACGGPGTDSVSGRCAATSRYPDAIGCAYVFGRVTDLNGAPLDSIDGMIRLGDECNCSSPRLEGDDNGFFSVTVHRLPRTGGFVDTASATVVALASAPKYPRHVTGAAYFDTLRVLLHFVPVGANPGVNSANLRIAIPGR